MALTRRDEILKELARRRDTLNPRQQEIIQELSNRGVLEADTPEVQEEFDPVATVQRSLKSAGFDPNIVKRGFTPEQEVSLSAGREATAAEVREISKPSAIEGELGRLPRPDGGFSTELSITVTDPRINGGRPTNIPTLVKGQEGVDDLLGGGELSRRQEEIAIRRAMARTAGGQELPAFNSIDEAVQAAETRTKLKGLRDEQERQFEQAQQAADEFRKIQPADNIETALQKSQPDVPVLRAVSSGFQQSILSSAGAVSRAFQDEDKARELSSITSKLAAVDAEKGRLSKAIAGASRSFTDLLTGGGGGASIPLFALKATNAAIDEGRAAGLTGSELGRFALTQGAIEGTITGAFQLIGAGGAESALRAPMAKGLRQALKQLGKGLAFEEVEELSVEIGQRVNSFLSGVDSEALDTNQLASAVLDITLQTALFSAAAQGPGAVQSATSSLLGGTQRTQDTNAPLIEETAQEAVQPPIQETTPESQIIDSPQEQTQAEGVSDPNAPDVVVDQDGEAVVPMTVEPTPVDQSGTPQTEESPSQAIHRTAGERSPEGTTSARKVDLEANREAMNNLLLDKQDTRTWEQALVAAQEQDIPNQAMKIARELSAAPRPLSDIETAGVVQRTMAIITEHNDLQSQINKADPTEARVLDAELRRLEQDHSQLTDALSISGTEKGRALNAQKLTLNQRFELITVLGRAKRAKGSDLNLTERARITSLTKDIKRLEKRLEALKNRKPSRRADVTSTRNKQLDKLIFEKAQVQGRINRVIENLKPRTWSEIAVREPLSIMRALKSSFDVSAVGRQAGLSTLAHPIRAAKNLGPMFRALASERAQFDINERIKNHPNFEMAKRAGLRITDTSEGASLNAKEENYRSRLADKIPGVRASDRAFSTFLNLMRMDGFNAMTHSLSRNGEPTALEASIIADTVNNFTGFGGLADMKKSSKVLNTVFWSPSLQLARFQVLVTRPAEVITGRRKGGQKIPARVRLAVAKEYGRMLLGMTVLIGLAKLAGFEVEENPKSSDFLKLKAGNTRIDIGAGVTQFLVLGTRLATGETKSPTTGKIRSIRGSDLPFGQGDAAGVIGRFVRSKFTPGLGLAIDVLSGKNVVGEKVDVSTPEGAAKVALNGLVPLSATEIFQSFKEQEVPAALGLSAMTLFGVGVQSFGPKPKPFTRRRKRRRSER